MKNWEEKFNFIFTKDEQKLFREDAVRFIKDMIKDKDQEILNQQEINREKIRRLQDVIRNFFIEELVDLK